MALQSKCRNVYIIICFLCEISGKVICVLFFICLQLLLSIPVL